MPQAHSGEVVQLSDIWSFNAQYWLLTISCIVVYGCVLPWNNIGGTMLQAQYGFNKEKSNSYLAVPYLVSAFCVPFFGYACDWLGRRSELLITSTAALTITHFLFAINIDGIDPIYPLILLGIAYSIYASAIWPSVALVVRESKLGTAYGLITAVQNGGLALFPIIVGALTGPDSKPNTQYFWVEIFFTGLGSFGVIVGLILYCLDYKRGGKLAKPSIKKVDETIDENVQNKTNLKSALLDEAAANDTNISLQTPDLLNEEHEKGNLEKTPVVMKTDDEVRDQ